MDEKALLGVVALATRYPTQFRLIEESKHQDEAEARETKSDWLHRIFACENPQRFKEELGVQQTTFDALKEAMLPSLANSLLQPQSQVYIDEVIATFLLVLLIDGGFRTAMN